MRRKGQAQKAHLLRISCFPEKGAQSPALCFSHKGQQQPQGQRASARRLVNAALSCSSSFAVSLRPSTTAWAAPCPLHLALCLGSRPRLPGKEPSSPKARPRRASSPWALQDAVCQASAVFIYPAFRLTGANPAGFLQRTRRLCSDAPSGGHTRALAHTGSAELRGNQKADPHD